MYSFLRRLLNPYFLLFAALLLAATYLLFATVAEGASNSVPLPTPETVTQLQAKYAAAVSGGQKVKVLIVPGHEPDFGGTEFDSVKERDVNVAIANQLALELKQDPHLDVVVARDSESWNPILASYFTDEWQSIRDFIASKKLSASDTSYSNVLQASHDTAPPDVATRLYGITKWADENGVDMAIHIHLNDGGDRNGTEAGNQSGFAVYVPDASFDNAPTSRVLGTAIANQLNQYNATSSLAIENLGVAGDQELIALGAFNTASYASVLVEYAYIYESKITSPTILPLVEKDFANSTYRGVERFFGRPIAYYNTLALPHRFGVSPPFGSTTRDTYSLQIALHRIGLYPPSGELFYDCPVSGYMGQCTVDAIKAFQQKNSLEQTGALGPRTRAALNGIWGRI
jgi:N-acetylmuramoyl-L-alanine amidase